MTNSEARKRHQAAQAPVSRPNAASVDSGAIGTAASPQVAEDWSVGIVAETVAGEVVLRMTEEQAARLRDGLNWLTGDDDE